MSETRPRDLAHKPKSANANSKGTTPSFITRMRKSVISQRSRMSSSITNSRRSATRRLREYHPDPILLLLTAMVPSALLTWCIADTVRYRRNPLDARVIGGHLTSMQAKAIDFASGAVFAPVLMAILDLIWFDLARVYVVNGRENKKSIPLHSLVEASTTSQGGFSPLKIITLLRGRTWRLALLSALFMLSGTAGRMLSNVVAYEATTKYVFSSEASTLERLQIPLADVRIIKAIDVFKFKYYSANQKLEFTNQLTGLFNELRFVGAISKLHKGSSYIGVNATLSSLNALDPTISDLWNVPGFELSLDCRPQTPEKFNIEPMAVREVLEERYKIKTSYLIDGTSNSTSKDFVATLQGQVPQFNKEYKVASQFPFAAFTPKGPRVFLGWAWGRKHTGSFKTPFGDMQVRPFRMGKAFQGPNQVMTVCGLVCTVKRQEGFVNLSRSARGSWERRKHSFSGPKSIQYSRLFELQLMLNLRNPEYAIEGIGPALAVTAGGIKGVKGEQSNPAFHPQSPSNWTRFAANYLYAVGESERIISEVAFLDKSRIPADAQYKIKTTSAVQFYQMTYVPLLLMLSLAAFSGVMSIVCVMAFYTRHSSSSRKRRQLNALRLVVDSVAGLRGSADDMRKAGSLSRFGLGRWAHSYKVKYKEMSKQDEEEMRLLHVEPRLTSTRTEVEP